MKPDLDYLTFSATGVQVTASASSQSVAIPNDASGVPARYVRILASGNAYVKPGRTGVTATVNDFFLNPNEGVVLNVLGQTHIAYLQESNAPKINITPLEVG
jgi:hypothetical protein